MNYIYFIFQVGTFEELSGGLGDFAEFLSIYGHQVRID